MQRGTVAAQKQSRSEGGDERDSTVDEPGGSPTPTSGGIDAIRKDLPTNAIHADAVGLPIRLIVQRERLDPIIARLRRTPQLVGPVVVWQASKDAGEYHLVSGLHELEAYRSLGLVTIPAVVLNGTVEEIARYCAERIPEGPGNWCEYEKAQAHGRAKAILKIQSGRAYARALGRGRNEIHRHLRIHKSLPGDPVMEALCKLGLSLRDLRSVTKDQLDELARREGTVADRIKELIGLVRHSGHTTRPGDEGRIGAITEVSESPEASSRSSTWPGIAVLLGLIGAWLKKLLGIGGGGPAPGWEAADGSGSGPVLSTSERRR